MTNAEEFEYLIDQMAEKNMPIENQIGIYLGMTAKYLAIIADALTKKEMTDGEKSQVSGH